jgi:hypothetical protein
VSGLLAEERVRGPAEASQEKALICELAARACREAFGSGLTSLVLTGSLARDEATFARMEAGVVLRGDAEFVLLFDGRTSLPSGQRVAALERAIEAELEEHALTAAIGLHPCQAKYLQSLPPHISAYELRACGRVVWGDAGAPSLVPAFTCADIPREDAFRILCNRLVELLWPLSCLDRPGRPPSSELRYRTTKLYLDMATSFLVFAGEYVPTYQGRAESLEKLARGESRLGGAPFALRPFAARVASCTRIKLGLDPEVDASMGWTFWRQAVLDAHALWRWELARLTGSDANETDGVLWERWRRRQPRGQRVRGWLHVVRACGWHRSWRHWAHWARLGLRASPRSCVYAAGTTLLFALPLVIGREEPWPIGSDHWMELERRLPVRTPVATGDREPWQQVAASVYLNYREFLVNTRS